MCLIEDAPENSGGCREEGLSWESLFQRGSQVIRWTVRGQCVAKETSFIRSLFKRSKWFPNTYGKTANSVAGHRPRRPREEHTAPRQSSWYISRELKINRCGGFFQSYCGTNSTYSFLSAEHCILSIFFNQSYRIVETKLNYISLYIAHSS